MNYLPKDTERPKVIKASATDIPVFYLNLTLKNDSAYSTIGQQSFLDLCEFAESVIKRRIEQARRSGYGRRDRIGGASGTDCTR